MRKRTLAREIALQILYQHEMNPQPSRELMDSYWDNNQEADPEVRIFTERLVEGTLLHRAEIDPMISTAADHWDLNRMAIVDRNILRLSAYEIIHVADIPLKVAINEAVELAKKYGDLESSKFVNGILDKIHKKELTADLPAKE